MNTSLNFFINEESCTLSWSEGLGYKILLITSA